MTAPLPQTGDTRARLLDAAEEHYAARGIDAVSLREIGRHAGARNARAAQYWFTDRDGLLRAILDRHEPSVDAGRNALLDVYEAQGRADVGGLADALVRPYAAKLGDGISGAGYLRVLADLLTQPRPSDAPWQDERFTSLRRWRRLAEPILDPDALALQAAHEAGMCHGRLDSAAFLLTSAGVLKLCGLGEPPWLAGVAFTSSEPDVTGDLAGLGACASAWAALAQFGWQERLALEIVKRLLVMGVGYQFAHIVEEGRVSRTLDLGL